MDTKWANGNAMKFKCNDPFEKRVVDKHLGQIKGRLHEDQGHDLKDIKIKWKTQVVELNSKVVAWMENGTMKYKDE
eukprot:8170160-Pyramimonas_sp.AAC.1